eukprot:3520029-Pyramimonas_sp.AAC.1
MDEFSRYEVDVHMLVENVSELIKALSLFWFAIFGPPCKLRLDMHGMHRSVEFKKFTDANHIALYFIPKECHHELGILERNRAVRREQIALYGERYKNDEFGDVLRITCGQRNRLRGVR